MHSPQLRDYFPDLPVLLGVEAGVNRYLDNWNRHQLLPKHDPEGYENAMIQPRALESSSIVTPTFGDGRCSCLVTSLHGRSPYRFFVIEVRGKTLGHPYLLVQLDHPVRKIGVSL